MRNVDVQTQLTHFLELYIFQSLHHSSRKAQKLVLDATFATTTFDTADLDAFFKPNYSASLNALCYFCKFSGFGLESLICPAFFR